MRLWTTFALGILVAALSLGVVWVGRPDRGPGPGPRPGIPFFRVEPEHVQYLVFHTDHIRTELSRPAGRWELVEPAAGRADPAMVEHLLDVFASVSAETVRRPRRGEDPGLGAYGLAAPRARIVVGDGRSLRTLEIGRDSPLGDRVYARVGDQADILAVDRRVLDALPSEVAALRDRRLFTGRPEDVDRLEIRAGVHAVEAVRDERGRWRIEQPFLARAHLPTLDRLLELAFAARVDLFVSEEVADPGLYGLGQPRFELSLRRSGREERQGVRIGAPMEGRPDLAYAQGLANGPVVSVPAALGAGIEAGLRDIRDRRVLPGWTALRGISIREDGRHLALVRDGQGWRMTEPRTLAAETEQLDALGRGLARLEFERFRDDVRTAGFPARLEMALVRDDGETEIVQIGPALADGLRLIRVAGPPAAAGEAEDLFAALSADPLALRSRDVLGVAAPDIRSVRIQVPDVSRTWDTVPGGGFARDGQPAGEADAALLDRLVRHAARLRAVRFVEENPDDLGRFGLDPPARSLTLGLVGTAGIAKTLIVGDLDPDGFRYAAVRGQDLVFLIDPDLMPMLFPDPLLPRRPEAEPGAPESAGAPDEPDPAPHDPSP